MKTLARVLGGLLVLSVLSWGMPYSAFAANNGTGQSHDGNGDNHSSGARDGTGDSNSFDHTGNHGNGGGGNDF